jgi:hypothetical protein
MELICCTGEDRCTMMHEASCYIPVPDRERSRAEPIRTVQVPNGPGAAGLLLG